MKNNYYFLRLLCLLLSTLSIYSQSKEDHNRKMPPHHLSQADKNKDGIINFSEFSNLPKLQSISADKIEMLFKRLDKNQDNILSRKELPKPHHPPFHPLNRKQLKELDLNKDKKLSLEEFIAHKPPEGRKRNVKRATHLFKMLDRDQDGFISQKDRTTPPDHPPHHRKERGLHPPRPNHGHPHHKKGPKRFEFLLRELDTNNDGTVDENEFLTHDLPPRVEVSHAEFFKTLDRNSDGVLTKEDSPEPKH